MNDDVVNLPYSIMSTNDLSKDVLTQVSDLIASFTPLRNLIVVDPTTNTATVNANATSADKLKTPRRIRLVQDVTGEVNFDGSLDVDITATIDKTAIGLNNVDNTSDANKPVSTATQTALDAKANVSHTHVIQDVTGLQTALDNKLDKVNGTATNLTTDKLVVSNTNPVSLMMANTSARYIVTGKQIGRAHV